MKLSAALPIVAALLVVRVASAAPKATQAEIDAWEKKNAASTTPLPVNVDLWQQIGDRMTAIHDLKYILVKQERLLPDKEMASQETFIVKFRKPYDLYMDVVGGPNEGRHYLFRKGWPYLKVHVFGRALQWLVPKIPPISKLALSGNHHAITDAAFDATVDIVRNSIIRNVREHEKDPSHPLIQIEPMKEVVDDGVPSLYFRSTSPEIYIHYTVTPQDKTIFDISAKTETEPYLIIYYNPDKVRQYDDVHAGQQLRIPMYYGKVSEFWVDKKTLLMRRIRVTDFSGKTYEEYEYKNMITGPEAGLGDFDFDPNNPEYGGF